MNSKEARGWLSVIFSLLALIIATLSYGSGLRAEAISSRSTDIAQRAQKISEKVLNATGPIISLSDCTHSDYAGAGQDTITFGADGKAGEYADEELAPDVREKTQAFSCVITNNGGRAAKNVTWDFYYRLRPWRDRRLPSPTIGLIPGAFIIRSIAPERPVHVYFYDDTQYTLTFSFEDRIRFTDEAVDSTIPKNAKVIEESGALCPQYSYTQSSPQSKTIWCTPWH